MSLRTRWAARTIRHVPEGDSLHRIALRLQPLVNERVVRVELPRTTVDARGLTDTTIKGVEARGKNLLVHFSADRSLHVHLAMRGRVELAPKSARPGPETVAIVETDAHLVVVRSAPVARLLRTKDLVRDRAFRDLGPDLLGPTFDLDEGLRRLRLRNERPLGEALLDQGAVSGIGNVWKSELCFLGGLDPFATVGQHEDDELRTLLERARDLMQANVHGPRRRAPDPFVARSNRVARDARQGESSLSVYDRAGQHCYACGSTITSASQGFVTPRITYVCPTCQPRR